MFPIWEEIGIYGTRMAILTRLSPSEDNSELMNDKDFKTWVNVTLAKCRRDVNWRWTRFIFRAYEDARALPVHEELSKQSDW